MITPYDPHAQATVLHRGADLDAAKALVIMLHGRGATAEGILQLGYRLGEQLESLDDIAFLAPQAIGNVWYPQSGFLAQEHLQPWLDSALGMLDQIVDTAVDAGIPKDHIILLGFSQGAMLALEYASRGSRKVGGVIAFSGALIGPPDEPHAPITNVEGLPIFVGVGTEDSWIPSGAAERSASQLADAGAEIDLRIYEGMDHTINDDEIEAAAGLIASRL